MTRLSINQLTTYRWSFEEDVCHYAAAGIGAIGIWRRKISDYGEEKAFELLQEVGLEVSNLLWAGGFTGSDGRSYRESLHDGAAAIRLAGLLNCRTLVVYSGGRGGHTRRHAWRLLTGALEALAPIAEEEAVDLAIEPMHPACAEEWTFLTSLNDALRVVNDLDHPNIKLAFDTYQLADEPQLVERIGRYVDRIGIVHLGDARSSFGSEQNRCPLGEGRIDLGSILTALVDSGYTGYLDVELMGADVEQQDYQRLIAQSKSELEKSLAVPV
jgi:sugar phosphate isomerase/epimerase